MHLFKNEAQETTKNFLKMNKLLSKIGSDRGSSFIGALLLMLIFGFAGTASIQMAATNTLESTNEMQSAQALYIGQGGLEYALNYLDAGYTPAIANKTFGAGNFTVIPDPPSSLITVASQAGDAKRTQSIGALFSKDCVALDTSDSHSEGEELADMKLIKTCNAAAHVTEMIIEWNWDPCVVDAPVDTPMSTLKECPVDDGDALVELINLSSTIIYDSVTGLGSPVGFGAESGEEINVVDFTLGANGTYIFEGSPEAIHFSTNHPGQALYTITVRFADGSEISSTFRDPTSLEEPVTVDRGVIEVSPDKNVRVEVLGSEITYRCWRWVCRVPVTVELGTSTERHFRYAPLFGRRNVTGGEVYETSSESGMNYTIRATAHVGWWWRIRYASTNRLQVKTLVDGDAAPNINPFYGQRSVADFLEDYVDDNGKISLAPNQAIMLFELSADMRYFSWSRGADFQDLVVLFTID